MQRADMPVDEDGIGIRANQGHSIVVDLKFQKAIPPAKLFHGTPENTVPSILKKGLLKMKQD